MLIMTYLIYSPDVEVHVQKFPLYFYYVHFQALLFFSLYKHLIAVHAHYIDILCCTKAVSA